MSSEDEKRLFDVGTENAGCEVAYNMAVISSNTLLRAGEIWQLRLHNLDLERRTIACSNKNGSVRHVPLNDEAYAAVRRLRDRAEKLGSTEPEHYLLPRRRKGGAFDPTRPQDSWERGWRKMVEAAELPDLRFRDLRRDAMISLLNSSVDVVTVRFVGGYLNGPVMCPVPFEAQWEALDRLSEDRKKRFEAVEKGR